MKVAALCLAVGFLLTGVVSAESPMVPMPGPWFEPNKTDFAYAVAAGNTSAWILSPPGNFALMGLWGCLNPCGDVPAPADYENVQVWNIAVFRQETRTWYVLRHDGRLMVCAHHHTGDLRLFFTCSP